MMVDKPAINAAEDSTLTVFVGAHIPLRLYHLLVEEAEGARVSRSEIIRQTLADRYDRPGPGREERHDES